jgi:hypothetical protein
VAGAALLLLGSGLIAWQQWTRVEPRAAARSAATSQSIPPVGAAAPQAEPAVETLVGPPPEAASKDAG